MDFMDDSAGLGLSNEQADQVLQFQELTGIEDVSVCRDVLQRHQWNLEVSVQEQLNRREGKPSVYALEARPPVVVSDHQLTQHVFYNLNNDDGNGGNGVRGFVRSLLNWFWRCCYTTVVTLLEIGRRLTTVGPAARRPAAISNPTVDVLTFIKKYEERYASNHPVFYQGTYSQVLSDAKRELKFLLIYLHNDSDRVEETVADGTGKFCRQVLSNSDVINYVNGVFLLWGCELYSEEGQRVAAILKPSGGGGATKTYQPFLAIVVLRSDNRMTIVSRMEGYCDATTLLERLGGVVAAHNHHLDQVRHDRMSQSLNRSLRAHQDAAYEQSLRADQEKERRKAEERKHAQDLLLAEELLVREELERKETIAREKIEFASRVPAEPEDGDPNALLLVIKLPSGERLHRRFLSTHSLQDIYYFVFCHPHSPDSFEITTHYPKRVLVCGGQPVTTIAEQGLKNKEMLFITDLDA